MMNTADSWSRVLRHLSLTLRPRESGTSAIPEARIQLLHFLETGQESYLQQARILLPGCQTSQELEELADVVECSRDPGAACMSNCGIPALAYVVSTLFFAITSLVILNLLLAVLMQSLQEHQKRINSERDEVKGNQGDMRLLMSVSRAAVGWRQAKKLKEDSDDEDAGPFNAGVSPSARLLRQQSDSLPSSRLPPLRWSGIDQSQSPEYASSVMFSQEAQSPNGADTAASSPTTSRNRPNSPIATAKRAMHAISGSFRDSFSSRLASPVGSDRPSRNTSLVVPQSKEQATGSSASSQQQSPGSDGQRNGVRTASSPNQPGDLPH